MQIDLISQSESSDSVQPEVKTKEFYDKDNHVHGFKDDRGRWHGMVEFFENEESTAPYKVAQYDQGVLHGQTFYYTLVNNNPVVDRSHTYFRGIQVATELFTDGKITEFYGNDLTGRRVGNFKRFYSNGNAEETGFFYNNEREGAWATYYPNGKVQTERQYRKGKLNGIEQIYAPDGTCVLYREWEDGQQHGAQKVTEKFYQGWKEIRSHYEHGVQSGEFEEYHNGQLRYQGTLLNGKIHGVLLEYENTILKSRVEYRNGTPHGFADYMNSQYTESGELVEGKRVGEWKFTLLRNEQHFMSKFYQDGAARSYICFDKSGQKREEGQIRGERPYGVITRYTREGVHRVQAGKELTDRRPIEHRLIANGEHHNHNGVQL